MLLVRELDPALGENAQEALLGTRLEELDACRRDLVCVPRRLARGDHDAAAVVLDPASPLRDRPYPDEQDVALPKLRAQSETSSSPRRTGAQTKPSA